MRRSKTLQKWRSSQPARLCCLGNFLPNFVRQAAHFSYDAIWLDLEHRAMSEREVQSLLAFFHLADIDCMLRPATLDKSRLYRYLEDGATGLMILHVSTVAKAEMLVDAVKFPPLGDRGQDGAGLDSDFILQGGESYPADANRETFLVVQIETLEAVENVDGIAAVDGVDGLFIGPGDLGLRIRTGDTLLTIDGATSAVAAAAKRHGKAWGCPAGTPARVRELHELGAQLVAYGGDFMAIMNMLRDCSETLDEVYGK
ncbi:MAG: aldolase/citrate lyase family protein [Pirellulaceae bacterium]